MKFVVAVSLLCLAILHAGPINIIQLGPPDPIAFKVSAIEDDISFIVNHLSSSGSFSIPDKGASISSSRKEVPSFEIDGTDSSKFLVLSPFENEYKWTEIQAENSNKWALRLVNLSEQEASVTVGGKITTLPPGADQKFDVRNKAEIKVEIGDLVEGDFPGEEACVVFGFIYRVSGTWKVFMIGEK